MRFSIVFVFALITVVFLSSESEAEENFTITINPGWEHMKETNCRIVNSGNGTYEECDWVTGYASKVHETNLTDTDWIISAPLDSEFTFTLNGTNFSSEATYNFSYKIFTSGGYSGERHDIDSSDYVEDDIELTSSSLIFIRNNNNSFSYNLSGNLSSNLLINETRGHYLGDCVQLYAIVTLEKNNNSIVEWTELYTSASFFPGQAGPAGAYSSSRGCSPSTQYSNVGWGYTLEEYFLFLGIFLVFGLAIIYGQAKLTSWHLRGSYSNKSTQYLAIFSSVFLFIFFVFIPPVFCLAALILFAQLVVYYTTDHYEKPAESEEGDLVDTKKTIWPSILFGLVLLLVLLGIMAAVLYSWVQGYAL